MAAPPLPRFSKAALAARRPACGEAEQPAHAWSGLLLPWDSTLQRRSRTQSTEGMRWAPAKPLQPLIRCLPAAPCHTVLQGGDIIRQLRAETGSRIKIEEAVDRCDERIVAISAPERYAALTECTAASDVADTLRDERALEPKRWHAPCSGLDWYLVSLDQHLLSGWCFYPVSMHLCSGPGGSVALPLKLCPASSQPHPQRSTAGLMSHAGVPTFPGQASIEQPLVHDGIVCESRPASHTPVSVCRASTQWSPAQEALFRVHSRIIEGDSEDTNLKDLVITARLLVDSSQIGCVLGKGGTIITQLRQDTGASIRILSSNEKPLCASPCDELVQVGGGSDSAPLPWH